MPVGIGRAPDVRLIARAWQDAWNETPSPARLTGFSLGLILQRRAEPHLNVRFRTRRLQRCAQEESRADREWGHDVGRAYLRRIATIRNVSEFRRLFDIASLRLHRLTGDRQGSYALALKGPWRLILTVEGDTAIIEEVSHHYGD